MTMRPFQEKETTVATKVLQGIRSAFCCTVCNVQGPERTSRFGNIEGQKHVLPKQDAIEKSFAEAVDSLTLIHFPQIKNMVSSLGRKASNLKSDDSRLELPPVVVQIKKKNSNEIWAPSTCQKSSWDIFYESQTSILGLPLSESVTQTDDDDDLFLPSLILTGDEGTDWEVTDSGACQPRLSESIIRTNTLFPEPCRRNGEIFMTCMAKSVMKYISAPWDMKIEEIANWLNNGSSELIPISRHIHPKRFMGETTSNFRKQTLSEIFGDRLNPEQAGITFFVGPVEGKMSFKMSVCDLKLLEKATGERIRYHSVEDSIIRYVS